METGSWLELDVVGLSQGDLGKLVLASGEANQVTFVGGYKRGTPKAYSTTAGSNATTLRLETNGELYEGMRYGFLNVTAPLVSPFVVTAVRAVVQVRPQNYAGSFFSAGDPLLEAVWWTGAFSIRTLATETYIGSVLVDRGDRISWTGDAFVSQGTMYAFAEDLAVLRQNLNVTSCPACCNGELPHCPALVPPGARPNPAFENISLLPPLVLSAPSPAHRRRQPFDYHHRVQGLRHTAFTSYSLRASTFARPTTRPGSRPTSPPSSQSWRPRSRCTPTRRA